MFLRLLCLKVRPIAPLMFFVLLSTIKAQRRLIRMMKKALIFTLAVLVVLLAGCGVMPADEKESATQSQTVSFPAGNETVSGQKPTEAAKETETPVQTEEEKVQKLRGRKSRKPLNQRNSRKRKRPKAKRLRAKRQKLRPHRRNRNRHSHLPRQNPCRKKRSVSHRKNRSLNRLLRRSLPSQSRFTTMSLMWKP